MPVECLEAVLMPDEYIDAISTVPSGKNDFAVGCTPDFIAFVSSKIDSGMEFCRFPVERVAAISKIGGQFRFGWETGRRIHQPFEKLFHILVVHTIIFYWSQLKVLVLWAASPV